MSMQRSRVIFCAESATFSEPVHLSGRGELLALCPFKVSAVACRREVGMVASGPCTKGVGSAVSSSKK